MGKGHKDRRKEKRAREMAERENDEHQLKEELEEETEKKNEEIQLRKKTNDKSIETLSDTDSGHGTSIATITDSPKVIKTNQLDESTENIKRQTLVKGLYNIGNTCFFNVIIQSLAHTSLLIDTMYQTICVLMDEHGKKYFSTTTAQLMKILDEFTSGDRKKPSIDPKPLFNSLIQKIPAYKGYDQHDSHELFMNLMLILRAEEIQLKQLEPRPSINIDSDDDPSKMFCLIGCNEPYTTYDSIFGGHLLDVMTCKKCGKSLMKIEPFLGLLLPLTDRMTPSENYRNRRKRENYSGNKSKKETKILSRKQQKSLQKQERKNQRRSAGASGKIKGRQLSKKKTVQEQLPLDEPSSTTLTEEIIPTNVENEPEQLLETTVEEKQDNSVQEEVEEKEEEEEEQQQPAGEERENDDDDEEEPKGPLTTVESTYMLSDMVSKLTLIHETSSRPLPFVDESIAQKFLNCSKPTKDSTTVTETDDIKTLEDCFQRYFKPETLSGENLFDCYYCRSQDQTQKKVLTEATRQTVFFQLPPILPVFLKRFQTYGSHSEKIQKFIQFPLQLDLTNRCSAQVASISPNYSLYAVIEHSGTLRSGHYVAYIKQTISNNNNLSDQIFSKPVDYVLANLFKTSVDNQECQLKSNKNTGETTDPSSPSPTWYYISDNTIHKVPETKVLEADAYVLFYRRI